MFKRPSRSADRFFTLLAQSSSRSPRLGLAISKKQVRRAVDRNRLKRLAREVFRIHRSQLACVDVVVMARQAAGVADNASLRRSLERHLRQVAGLVID